MAIRSLNAGAMFSLILVNYLFWLAARKVLGKERTRRIEGATHSRGARILHRGILRLEGVYIKVGQFISMMTGFLPDAYLDELEGMQDSVPPRPYGSIRARVESELGLNPFTDFAPEPVASASLGQVHFATVEGTQVAVKVQYPGIERVVATDLAMIRIVVHVISWFLRGMHYERVYDDLSETIRSELDYLSEGANAEAIAANFVGDNHVEFPTIIWKYTTSKVLTMERETGLKITDVAAIREAEIEPVDVIEKLVQSYFKQLLIDSLYHADPHPGNFFVKKAPDGKPLIVFLDFGSVVRFPPEFREGMRTVVYGYMSRDDSKVIDGMRQMGFASAGGDEAVFEQAVRHYMDKLLHFAPADFSRIDISDFDLVKNMDEMQVSFRELTRAFEVPRNWFYVERTLALLLGLCARLDPTVDAFVYGFPYAVQFVFGGDAHLASIWGQQGVRE
ncbi:MAG: hypothetical protein DCC49_02645 [Acidobacteria bacterium]|nr:MAG: hypothetical protein DCC49_02645 [Acidobacteriota bacterium]